LGKIQSDEDIANFEVLMDVTMATIFWLSIYVMHIGATWRIQLNHSCAAAMWPNVKLLSPVVYQTDALPAADPTASKH